MRSIQRTLMALFAVLVLGFAVAACGGDDSDTGGGGGGGGGETTGTTGEQATAIEKDPANSGKTVTVGSKNFAEQYILGEIYSQALEAAGFTVKKQLDLGSEQVAFKSL
jgi:ABC-type proline/glycine betaine transport system substrate-binding protein